MKIDKSIIKELSDYLEEFNLTEIEITEKDTKIKVSKNNVSISNQPSATSANIRAGNENVSEKPSVKSGTEITSPIIGTAVPIIGEVISVPDLTLGFSETFSFPALIFAEVADG